MKQSRQKGFTLIEGLLTVLVISLGFLAVARLQLNIWRNHLESTQRNEAVQLGFEKLNEQRQSVSIQIPIQNGGQDTVNAALTHYDRSWKNSPLPIAGQQHQLEINWGLPQDKHNLSFQTVIGSKNRLDNGVWVSRFD